MVTIFNCWPIFYYSVVVAAMVFLLMWGRGLMTTRLQTGYPLVIDITYVHIYVSSSIKIHLVETGKYVIVILIIFPNNWGFIVTILMSTL